MLCGNWAMPKPASVAATTACISLAAKRPTTVTVSWPCGPSSTQWVPEVEGPAMTHWWCARSARRSGTPRRIVRAGAEQPVRGAEFAGDQRGILKDAGAESEVYAVFDQVELVVGQAELDLGFWIYRQKVDHGSCEEMAAEANRRRNADRARWLRSRFGEAQICFLDRPQRLAALLVI